MFAALSSFTSDKRSSIIFASLSISSEISCINSAYISFGTFSIPISESAKTLIEVIGVFSSCDTFATNSSLNLSAACNFASVVLIFSDMDFVSLYSLCSSFWSSFPYPMLAISSLSFVSGLSILPAVIIESTATMADNVI